MAKAVRFSVVNTVAEAVADMLNTIAYEASVDCMLEDYLAYKEGFFDKEGYPISRETVEWYMTKYNCGVIEAVERYNNSQEQLHNSNVMWLADESNWDSEIYSDVFKDTYGFRPRW